MRSEYQLLNTALTAFGIGCSLLAAMLIIEYTIVGDFKSILAYSVISFVIANIYLISMLTSSFLLKRRQLSYNPHIKNIHCPLTLSSNKRYD